MCCNLSYTYDKSGPIPLLLSEENVQVQAITVLSSKLFLKCYASAVRVVNPIFVPEVLELCVPSKVGTR